ncbi:hypothetical protein AVEN_16734-1 [Araneus ventricosus]|uniref:Uncharacterized protein n=1 Tax=Araneus ventricosus TaxID=182803 RepID=A0A4Y2GG84_ARAVE|nr:hypothetical protein AVEN_16734-1 [Araneus ventricosus]
MLVERLSPRWSSTGLTPFLGRPGQCGYFYATPTGGRLATSYDLACNKPHTRRIFSGVGFGRVVESATCITLNLNREFFVVCFCFKKTSAAFDTFFGRENPQPHRSQE